MRNFKLRSLLTSLFLLSLGCTAFLRHPVTRNETKAKEEDPKVSLSKCSFENGFKDSVEERGPSELCYLVNDQPYKQGFLNGNSYISRKEQVNSLDVQIKNKEETFKYLAQFRAVEVSGWKELQAFQEDISKMKKEKFFLEADMNSYKNRDNY